MKTIWALLACITLVAGCATVGWPRVTVKGVVGRGVNAYVVLDNNIVRVGESHGGIKVIGVGKEAAVLSYKGDRMRVKVGGSTR